MSIKDLDLQQIYSDIRTMQSTAERLLTSSERFPALNRNTRRIQAALRMMELDICDLVDLERSTAK